MRPCADPTTTEECRIEQGRVEPDRVDAVAVLPFPFGMIAFSEGSHSWTESNRLQMPLRQPRRFALKSLMVNWSIQTYDPCWETSDSKRALSV
jgi:hypothetical protein